jgi:hypothetical protein
MLPPKKKLSKILPKQQVAPPEPVEEEELEEELEEETRPTPPKKKMVPIAKMAEEEDDEEIEEEEVAPPPKKMIKTMAKPTKKSALAQAFAAVPMSNNATNVKAGVYEALIRSFVLQAPDAKGQSVRINAELCGEDFSEANQLVDWRMLINKDGDPVMGGIRALGNDLARLGYEIPAVDEDFDENLEATFEAITKEKPGVNLKVTYQHYNGVDYQHFSIQGECDNEVIQAYRENTPY